MYPADVAMRMLASALSTALFPSALVRAARSASALTPSRTALAYPAALAWSSLSIECATKPRVKKACTRWCEGALESDATSSSSCTSLAATWMLPSRSTDV